MHHRHHIIIDGEMRFKWLLSLAGKSVDRGVDVTWLLINPSSADFIACQDSDSG